MDYAREIEQSVAFLNSSAALNFLKNDAYWPKWHSTWWHMSLLHEMGLTHEIPEKIAFAHVEAMNRIPVKIFPIHPGDVPEGVDPQRGTPCHCQLGNVYQVLSARGVDVDQDVPWIRPWFLRYQMADGGLTCDNDAYLVKDEVPSSMVGTIAVFEAVLLGTKRPWTSEEKAFLRKGADFLIGRELRLGSSTKHNADERISAEKWAKLCFPRYYFYDVLRGLNAILLWSEKTGESIPANSIAHVVQDLNQKFPNGSVRIERRGFEGTATVGISESGERLGRQDASFFPLLEKVSQVGEVSPFLSKQWSESVARMKKLNLAKDLQL